MKPSQLVEALKPLFAADTKPEAVTAAINAAFALDKKAKDEECTAAEKKAAADKAAKDTAANDPPGKDGEMNGEVDGEDEDMDGEDEASNMGVRGAAKDKKGMDAAIGAAVTHALAQRDALHVARRAVEPTLGADVGMDSAEAVYAAALTKIGVDIKGVDASAYRSLFEIATKKTAPAAVVVGDSAAKTAIPHYNRLSR